MVFSISLHSQTPKLLKTIIVDAGHGGSDNGAVGQYEGSLRSKEKDITLAISKKLVASGLLLLCKPQYFTSFTP